MADSRRKGDAINAEAAKKGAEADRLSLKYDRFKAKKDAADDAKKAAKDKEEEEKVWYKQLDYDSLNDHALTRRQEALKNGVTKADEKALVQFDEFHPILPDPLHEDRLTKIQSVAGTDITDQIGRSVHSAAMAGGEANPEQNRHLIRGPGAPVPKVQTSAEAAEESFKAIGAANNAKKAAEEAEKEAKI